MPEYNPPINANYAEVVIPMYINPYELMGKSGRNLVWFTQKTGTQYIWVDIRRSMVEIWGPEKTIPFAIRLIRRRIDNMVRGAVSTPEFMKMLPIKVQKSIEVKQWSTTGVYMYEIIGVPEAVDMFMKMLIDLYPFNPYFTNVNKYLPNGLIASRLKSCS